MPRKKSEETNQSIALPSNGDPAENRFKQREHANESHGSHHSFVCFQRNPGCNSVRMVNINALPDRSKNSGEKCYEAEWRVQGIVRSKKWVTFAGWRVMQFEALSPAVPAKAKHAFRKQIKEISPTPALHACGSVFETHRELMLIDGLHIVPRGTKLAPICTSSCSISIGRHVLSSKESFSNDLP